MLILPQDAPELSVALLSSGGVESCFLVSELCDRFKAVYPVYMQFGLAWETVEQFHLRRFLEQMSAPNLHELTVLRLPVTDMYGEHWSTTGRGVPDAATQDEAVYLPGRNLLFLSKLCVWSALNSVDAIAMGSLGSNPFPDASQEFIESMQRCAGLALGRVIRILQPLSDMHKQDVIELSRNLPLELSFSCIKPVLVRGEGIHCGLCNKCYERQQGFAQAHLPDRTTYAAPSFQRFESSDLAVEDCIGAS